MDPDHALDNARRALSAWLAVFSNGTYEQHPRDKIAAMLTRGKELADAFEVLDMWLSKGGFLPTAWASAKR